MKMAVNCTKLPEVKNGLVALATLTAEDCVRLSGIQIRERQDGSLFVSYPRTPVYERGEDGERRQKTDKDGKPVYMDILHGTSKEVDDTVRALVMEAYEADNGWANLYPEKGNKDNGSVAVSLSARDEEVRKAAGSVVLCGYMKVHRVHANLRVDAKGQEFIGVSLPGYTKDGEWKPYVELLKDGKWYNLETHQTEDKNWETALRDAVRLETIKLHPELAELHPELAEQAKGKVGDVLAAAEAASKATAGEPAKEGQEHELA